MSYDRTLKGKDKMSEDELENPVKIEVESLSCCQCGSVIGQDEDIFDCDTCLNSSCASCRSKDRLGCLLCNKANDAGVKTEQSKEETPDDILKYYTKKKLHTNHIQDVRGIEHMSEDEIDDPINGEVLSLSCRQCCQCGSVIGRDEEVFDSDTCEHSTCVSCRFNDRLACLLCKADVRTEETKEETPDDIWKHYKKKKLNIDHIVDVRVDGSAKKQKCTVCQRVFKKTNARYHYACASGNKPLRCVECGQKFVKRSHLEFHMNRHYGIKPFKCTEGKCKASFAQKDKLVRHMKIHDREFHQCPVCDKSYSSLPNVRVHMVKVHSITKPYQCNDCPRSYKYKKSLQVHSLKHLAIQEHMCEVCGKKFTLSTQLKLHKKSHIPYKHRAHSCSCGKRFMTRTARARHYLTHINQLCPIQSASRDYECSLCNTTFGRKDNMERHMRNFHQEDPPLVRMPVKPSTAVSPLDKSPLNLKKENKTESVKDTSEKSVKILVNSKRFKKKKNVKQDIPQSKESSLPLNESQEDPQKPGSVIVSPKPSEKQNRPSVIKNITKLLSYRILPPDKRFLKMSDELSKEQNLSILMPPPLGCPNSKGKTNRLNCVTKQNSVLKLNVAHNINKSGKVKSLTKTLKPKVVKDDALNRCFRIIRHTNSFQINQAPSRTTPPSNSTEKEDIISEKFNNTSLKSKACKDHLKAGPSCSFVPVEETDKCNSKLTSRVSEAFNTNQMNLGGPSLLGNTDSNVEDSLNSYVPLGESYSYTPYFDNDFRDSMSCYEDLDIGFQYINEQFSADVNFSESKTVRYVPQETRVVRESSS